MIDNMLMDVARQGYSPEDIKKAVVKVLEPYFTHIDALNRYACDSQLLSAFEFFVRYYNENEFAQGIKAVINCYKIANINYKQEFWNIILSTYAVMVLES